MKFILTFKTPDVTDQIPLFENPQPSNSEFDKAVEFVHKYLRYGEIVDIEFNTETKTVRVLEQQ